MGPSPFKTLCDGMDNHMEASEETPLSVGRPTQPGLVGSQIEVRHKTDDTALVPRAGVSGGDEVLSSTPQQVTAAGPAISTDHEIVDSGREAFGCGGGNPATSCDDASSAKGGSIAGWGALDVPQFQRVRRATDTPEDAQVESLSWDGAAPGPNSPLTQNIHTEQEKSLCEVASTCHPRVEEASATAPIKNRGAPYVRKVETVRSRKVLRHLGLQKEVAELMGRVDPAAVSITPLTRSATPEDSAELGVSAARPGAATRVARVVLEHCDAVAAPGSAAGDDVVVVVSSDQEDEEMATDGRESRSEGGTVPPDAAPALGAGSAAGEDSEGESPVGGVVRRRGGATIRAAVPSDSDGDDAGGGPLDVPLPSSDGGTDGGGRPGFVPGKRGRKPGVWTDPKRLGPGMKAPPGRAELRNWAETMTVDVLAGQAQRELDAVAAVVGAAKHLKTTDTRAVRIAIRRASAVAAELTGRAERGENPNRLAREVVFRQGAWERRSHKLSTQVRALTDQAHSLGESLHVKDRELEFLRGKYARLETRMSLAGLDAGESEELSFRPRAPLPTRSELLPSCLAPWSDSCIQVEVEPTAGPS